MRKFALCCLCLEAILGMTSVPIAKGEWAPQTWAPSSVEDAYTHYTVNEDGSYTYKRRRLFRVLKESARDDLGVYTFSYCPKTTKVKLLQAYIVTDGKRQDVPREYIEDKPRSNGDGGFDEQNVLKVAFPNVKIGSDLGYELEVTVARPNIDGLFAKDISFGEEYFDKKRVVEFDTPFPLELRLNDPEGVLKVKKETDHGRYFLRVENTKPLYRAVTNEEHALLDRKLLTWIHLSSLHSWQELGEKIVKGYEERIGKNLPEIVQRIVKRAAREATPQEQIDVVMNEIAQEFRYVGDWRAVEGAYFPRALETVAKDRFGDCKELALVAVAALRSLGLDANVAWVERAKLSLAYTMELPSLEFLNHAVVAVKTPGRDFWIDPTNSSFPAALIPEDIAGRPALVLDPKGPFLGAIPAEDPKASRYSDTMNIQFTRAGKHVVEGQLRLVGVTGFQIDRGKHQRGMPFDRVIGQAIRSSTQAEDLKVRDTSVASKRPGMEASFAYEYTAPESDVRTSCGPGTKLEKPHDIVRFLSAPVKGRVSDFVFSKMETTDKAYHFRGIEFMGEEPVGCELDTPWFFTSRKLEKAEKNLSVVDRFQPKMKKIPAADLTSPAFAQAQQKLRDCFSEVVLVYRKK